MIFGKKAVWDKEEMDGAKKSLTSNFTFGHKVVNTRKIRVECKIQRHC